MICRSERSRRTLVTRICWPVGRDRGPDQVADRPDGSAARGGGDCGPTGSPGGRPGGPGGTGRPYGRGDGDASTGGPWGADGTGGPGLRPGSGLGPRSIGSGGGLGGGGSCLTAGLLAVERPPGAGGDAVDRPGGWDRPGPSPDQGTRDRPGELLGRALRDSSGRPGWFEAVGLERPRGSDRPVGLP